MDNQQSHRCIINNYLMDNQQTSIDNQQSTMDNQQSQMDNQQSHR